MFGMKPKKLWIFLLLFTINFSLLHDIAFVLISPAYHTNDVCIVKTDNKKSNILCQLHSEYHSQHMLLRDGIKLSPPETVAEVFEYTYNTTTKPLFEFLKPPIT